MKLRRSWWICRDLEDKTSDDGPAVNEEDRYEVATTTRANLLGSPLRGQPNMHAPTLDIDLPCELIPSSTKGHYHLLIDKPMPWSDYVLLLSTLAKVGIIEDGYLLASLRRGATFIRKPGATKRDTPLPSDKRKAAGHNDSY